MFAHAGHSLCNSCLSMLCDLFRVLLALVRFFIENFCMLDHEGDGVYFLLHPGVALVSG